MRAEAGPLVRVGIVVLALMVAVCLVLPMAGASAMHATMVCCFVLAVLLSIAILIRSAHRYVIGVAHGQPRPRPLAVLPFARAPDPVELGALLI